MPGDLEMSLNVHLTAESEMSVELRWISLFLMRYLKYLYTGLKINICSVLHVFLFILWTKNLLLKHVNMIFFAALNECFFLSCFDERQTSAVVSVFLQLFH